MNAYWKAAGAAAWGAVGFGGLLPFLSESARRGVEQLCPQAAGVFVAAFPYYAGQTTGNLSLYCRGEDYHRVLQRRLETICQVLQEKHPTHTFLAGADNSPLPERTAARLAGIGLQGRHGLVILPPYGSYVFLGTILTDLPLQTTAAPAPDCPNCGACVAACPTAALGADTYRQARCLSDITQRKGALTAEEVGWLQASETIWGCDLCQRACPFNQAAAQTTLPEFLHSLRPSLSLAELEHLSQRQFRDAFGHYAFAWRGIAPLRRNLQLWQAREKVFHINPPFCEQTKGSFIEEGGVCLQVRELMNSNVIRIAPDESAALAARLLARHNIGILPVCSDAGTLRGVVTDRDIILRCVAAEEDPAQTLVRSIMSRNCATVAPDDDIRAASQLMSETQVRRLPVVEDGKVVGMLALCDLARSRRCETELSQTLSELSENVRYL